MKTEFTAKYLQHLVKKNKDKGFTLIELLVVVIIIGVLAAVALPNLLGQVGKARETELKNAVGTVNRAQQSYHFEKQAFTASDVTLLGTAVTGKVINSVTLAAGTSTSNVLTNNAEAVNDGTRAYSGRMDFGSGNYSQIVCQTTAIGTTGVAPTSATQCADATSEIK